MSKLRDVMTNMGFETPGQQLRVGELLEKQREIYYALGVEPLA